MSSSTGDDSKYDTTSTYTTSTFKRVPVEEKVLEHTLTTREDPLAFVRDLEIDPDLTVVSAQPFISSNLQASKFLNYLCNSTGVSAQDMLQGLAQFTIEVGTSLRASDAMAFKLYSTGVKGRVAIVTMLDIKRALDACGEAQLRRVMRSFADYARRLLMSNQRIRPLGLRKRPDLAAYRHLLFDYADGCLDPPLTPLEYEVVLKYRRTVLSGVSEPQEVVEHDLD
jgi:hypothetical protein